ncbi:energy-dependent translational throttle protein EttA [bacterium]|nr:energy-dependent translational throttle protein EttA [bacterium]
MPQIAYTLKGLNKYHGSKQVLKNVYLSFFDDAKIGIIGYNGAGKSTLLRIMAGIDTDFQGEAFAKDGLTVGYLEQEPKLNEEKTVKENVMEGVGEVAQWLQDFNTISEKFAEEMTPEEMEKLLAQQADLQDKIEAANGWELDTTLEIAMEALRCPPGDSPVTNLSGGERRRVALCKLLLSKPDMLLLDEPTNHLDAESVSWLEKHLKEYPGLVITVTHDRYFLDNVASWILEIDRGQTIPFEQNYSGWLGEKSERLGQEEKQESKRKKALARELEWIRKGAKGRQAKGKARIQSYENMLAESTPEKLDALELFISPGQRLGGVVIEADKLQKAFGDKLLFDGVDFQLPPGGIVGVIGPNGAGKTTLFKMIMGKETPDSGDLKIGETVKLAYVDQGRDLDPNKTIFDEISGGEPTIKLGNHEVNSRNYVARFNFSGNEQSKKVGELSGGERNRVHLAKMLREGGNVLLLDEPTNDLDVNTLRALEEALDNFAGCAVVISHDRWFLDRVATHILAFEGDSKVVWFEGNFEAYQADKRRRLGTDADIPKRIQYRKLTR